MERLGQLSLSTFLKDLCISELDQNWEAVDSSFSEVERKHYYINVCHKVWKKGGASSCPDGAAICSVGECFCWFVFVVFMG